MTDVTLGARVEYHHRAAVARWNPPRNDFSWRNGWMLHEGATDHARPDLGWIHEDEMFKNWPEQKRGTGHVNKTIMVWPEEGVGVVTGKVRRQVGTSHRASRGGGGVWGDDFDPGYFDPIATFDLYVIRHELRGTNYILVPTWAVRPADEGDRLRRLIAAYLVESGRAPNNRDEEALDAAARALVAEAMHG